MGGILQTRLSMGSTSDKVDYRKSTSDNVDNRSTFV